VSLRSATFTLNRSLSPSPMSAHPKPSPPAAAPESGDPVEQALYAKREHVYPREVHGRFARWRVLMVGITLGIYYGLPWIDWGDGRQAFLIDLPGRKFNLFFWTFWPQDLFYLTAILVIAALSLFLDRKSTRLNSSHVK